MSIEAVKKYFREFGMEKDIMEFDTSSATVELAANALSVIPARIAKTLSFSYEESCLLIVTAGDAKIDNAKFKAKFGLKARMLAVDEVLRLVGHEVGGVCPFCVREGVPVFLDVSLKRFETVYPACGAPNSAIELDNEDLYKYSKAKEWVDICKGWQE